MRNNDGAIALRGADLASAVPTTSTVVTGNSFSNMNTSLHAGPCAYPANQCGWAGVEVTRVAGTATVTDNTFDNLQLGSFGEGEGLQAWMVDTLTVPGNSFKKLNTLSISRAAGSIPRPQHTGGRQGPIKNREKHQKDSV